MVTFIIAGAWHGAAITFIFWGFVQGIILSIEALTKKQKSLFENRFHLTKNIFYIIFSIIFTFLLFAFSLLFGGAVNNLSESFVVINKIVTDSSPLFLDKPILLYAFIGITMLFLSEFRDEFFPKKLLLFNNKNVVIRWGSYYFIALIIIFLGAFEGSEFIYFQF